MYKQQLFNDFFQRLNNCTSGTLAHVILEMGMLRVARLSNHMPPLLALIIFLTVGRGIFLPLLFKIRLALFPLIFLFFWENGAFHRGHGTQGIQIILGSSSFFSSTAHADFG